MCHPCTKAPPKLVQNSPYVNVFHFFHRILRVQCKDLKLSGEFDFKSLASQTPGFVGADLTALVREAAMCAVTR